MLDRDCHYHFLGVGGVGMSALAELLHRRGFVVSGSDREDSDTLRRLAAFGISTTVGHMPDAMAGAGAVVYSTAIDPKHSIWAEVARRGLPRLHRAEVLGMLTAQARALCVTGTHGKTTSTAALATVLEAAGCDPTALVGGHVPRFGGGNLRMGATEWMVVEADESDGSFRHLTPAAILLTNIEADHLERHGSLDKLVDSFSDLLARLPAGAPTAYCADDPLAARVAAAGPWRAVSYGTGAGADVRVADVRQRDGRMVVALHHQGREVAFASRLAGAHNALNLAGVFALAAALALPEASVLAGLAAFQGVARRQQLLGRAFRCEVYDDYAHHPTEIRATLAMFHANFDLPISVVFQPHLYSRTAAFAAEFAEALRSAATVVVMPIYAAREAPMEGVTHSLILERLADHPAAHHAADGEAVARLAAEGAFPPGILVTMGAGDIAALGPRLVAQGGEA